MGVNQNGVQVEVDFKCVSQPLGDRGHVHTFNKHRAQPLKTFMSVVNGLCDAIVWPATRHGCCQQLSRRLAAWVGFKHRIISCAHEAGVAPHCSRHQIIHFLVVYRRHVVGDHAIQLRRQSLSQDDRITVAKNLVDVVELRKTPQSKAAQNVAGQNLLLTSEFDSLEGAVRLGYDVIPRLSVGGVDRQITTGAGSHVRCCQFRPNLWQQKHLGFRPLHP